MRRGDTADTTAGADVSALPSWAGPGLLLLALAFQLTLTLPVSETGLTASAADLVGPVLAAAVFARLWAGGAGWPQWRMRGVWLWLGVLSAWMTISLLRGHTFTGTWVEWAVVNKYVGWFVLLGFFLLGAGIRCALPRAGYETFLKGLFLSAWAIAGMFVVLFTVSKFGLDIYPHAATSAARLRASFSNPNAYGYFLALLLALQAPYLAGGKLLPRHVHLAGLVIAALALILTGSRSGWLGAAVALAGLAWLRAVDLRATLRGVAAALLAAVVIYFGPSSLESLAYHLDLYAVDLPPRGPRFSDAYALRGNVYGLEERVASMRMGFALWTGHPVLGVGLGGFLWTQIQAGADHLVLLHTTAQWLLTETGAVGLALFVAFFLGCLVVLLRARRDRADAALPLAVLGMLLVFAGASLGLEALYQRHLWFILGLALALPKTAPEGDGRPA